MTDGVEKFVGEFERGINAHVQLDQRKPMITSAIRRSARARGDPGPT